MALSAAANIEEFRSISTQPDVQADNPRIHTSGLSWGAILAGAAAVAALSLILLMLGIGLGLSAVSPWARDGVNATTFGISAIIWVTFTQLVASGMGGYLTGRLRTKWVAVHTDEVYFRDTAHGFLSWAIASLVTAALLSSAIGSMINGTVQAAATVAAGTAGAFGTSAVTRSDSGDGPTNYYVESLFRKDATNPSATAITPIPADYSSEVTRIYINAIREVALPAEDVKYVGQLVAQRTGLTQQDAEKRVTDTYMRMQTKMRDAETAAKDVADKARKASAYAALWLFISLLIGAFVASLSATYGGRRRDV